MSCKYLPIHSAPFLQMPISTEHRKRHVIAYQRQWQYVFHHQFRLIPGHALFVSACIFMLPVLGIAAEHFQIITTCHINPIHQWHVHPHRTNFNHKTIELPSLNNVLPAMILENIVVRLNRRCLLHTSFHSKVSHSLCFMIGPTYGVEKKMVKVVVVLLLLLSGDVETNPGPIGKFLPLLGVM